MKTTQEELDEIRREYERFNKCDGLKTFSVERGLFGRVLDDAERTAELEQQQKDLVHRSLYEGAVKANAELEQGNARLKAGLEKVRRIADGAAKDDGFLDTKAVFLNILVTLQTAGLND